MKYSKIFIAIITTIFIQNTNANYSAKVFIDGLSIKEVNEEEIPETPSNGVYFNSSNINLNSIKTTQFVNNSGESIVIPMASIQNIMMKSLDCGATPNFSNEVFSFFDGNNFNIPDNEFFNITFDWNSDYSGNCNITIPVSYSSDNNNGVVNLLLRGTETTPSNPISMNTSDFVSLDFTNNMNRNFQKNSIYLNQYGVDSNGVEHLINTYNYGGNSFSISSNSTYNFYTGYSPVIYSVPESFIENFAIISVTSNIPVQHFKIPITSEWSKFYPVFGGSLEGYDYKQNGTNIIPSFNNGAHYVFNYRTYNSPSLFTVSFENGTEKFPSYYGCFSNINAITSKGQILTATILDDTVNCSSSLDLSPLYLAMNIGDNEFVDITYSFDNSYIGVSYITVRINLLRQDWDSFYNN